MPDAALRPIVDEFPPPGAPPSALPSPASARSRFVDAALACLAGRAWARTTADDIARAAGMSRATLYRTFPGGRDEVLAAVVHSEVARLFEAVGAAVADARDLAGALAAALVVSVRHLSSHAALRGLLESEPGLLLAHLAFDRLDRVLDASSRLGAPLLARWLPEEEARRTAEWLTRLVLSYVSCPSPGIDLGDPADACRVATSYVLPGVRAMGVERGRPLWT